MTLPAPYVPFAVVDETVLGFESQAQAGTATIALVGMTSAIGSTMRSKVFLPLNLKFFTCVNFSLTMRVRALRRIATRTLLLKTSTAEAITPLPNQVLSLWIPLY